MIGSAVVVLSMALDGAIGRVDGALLFLGLIGYIGVLIRKGQSERPDVTTEFDDALGDVRRKPLIDVGLVVTGLVMLVGGSNLLLGAAVTFAEAIGVSQLVIGLTLVAVGTSLPEIATSILAAIRGQRDIAVGNVVGSNIFNLLGVLGLASIAAPNGVRVARGALDFDLPVMLATVAVCLPVFFTGYIVARWEGGVFVAYYVAYTLYLLLNASKHDVLAPFSAVMWWFVIPLTVVAIAISVIHARGGSAVE
jgi:cation:H+ antiporter